MDVVRCRACAGVIVYDAAREHARCLFCASVALEPAELDEALPPPEAAVTFAIDLDEAHRRFRSWISRSWWRPKEVHQVAASLQALWVPCWRIDADVETHWAGLERAATLSGRRPVSGTDVARARAFVPASGGITVDELTRLQPFDQGDVIPWSKETEGHPYEPVALSEGAALGRSRPRFARIRARAIAHRQQVSSCRVSLALSDVESRLLMFPVFIGSFRHRDRPWRFVVNGTSGAVVGRAPIDRLKLVLVSLVVLGLVALVTWLRTRMGT